MFMLRKDIMFPEVVTQSLRAKEQTLQIAMPIGRASKDLRCPGKKDLRPKVTSTLKKRQTALV
jgi:hypothetical protein